MGTGGNSSTANFNRKASSPNFMMNKSKAEETQSQTGGDGLNKNYRKVFKPNTIQQSKVNLNDEALPKSNIPGQ